MERLVLIGVSHRRGGIAAVEQWQREYPMLPSDLSDAVLLTTCNRWDLVLSLPEAVSLAELRSRLTPAQAHVKPYVYQGEAALEQLIRVAASLDSLNPGEDQIMKQVREAFALAQAEYLPGPVTSFAFHTALRVAKRVRREVPLAPLNTSLFSLAKPALLAELPPQGTVALLGAGEMASLVVKSLALEPVKLIIVNRDVQRAASLAQQVGVCHLALSDFLHEPPAVDALVCATSRPNLVDAALLAKLPYLKVIVDLGLPRNLALDAMHSYDKMILDIDRLRAVGARRREALSDQLAQAEELIREELEQAMLEWLERQLGPSIKKLRDLYLTTIAETLSQEDAAKLAHKFAHVPVKGLRALARSHGLEAVQTFLTEAGLA